MMRRLLAATLLCLFTFSLLGAEAAPHVVDDFNDDILDNPQVGGSTGVWGDPTDRSVSCRISLEDSIRRGDAGGSLRVDYDVQSDRESVYIPTNYSLANPARIQNKAANGFYMDFDPIDLRKQKYMTLWIKGDESVGFSRSIRVEVKDAKNTSGVLLEGITDEWKEFSIHLRRFKEIQNWSTLRSLVFVFSPDTVSQKQGRLYIDDIAFKEVLDRPQTNVNEQYGIRRVAKPPKLDGSLKEWSQDSFVNLSPINNYLQIGDVSNQSDLTVWFSMMWNETNLYWAVDVRDNEVVNDKLLERINEEDSFALVVNRPVKSDDEEPKTENVTVWASPTSSSFWILPMNRYPSRFEVEGKAREFYGGYHFEGAVSWQFLGITPSSTKELAVSLIVNDQDTWDRTPHAQIIWNAIPTEGGAPPPSMTYLE